MSDLKNNICRTCYDPIQSFLDDPLRCLRVIRYACRFNLQIEKKTLEALKNEKVRHHYLEKCTVERNRDEIWKMLEKPSVGRALGLVIECGYLDDMCTIESDVINNIIDGKKVDDDWYRMDPKYINQTIKLYMDLTGITVEDMTEKH
eukprot:UN28516